MTKPPRDLITINAAADRLGWHQRTVRRKIAEGKIPAYRIGEYNIRVRQADVDALIRPIATAQAS